MNKLLAPFFISLQHPMEGNRAISAGEQKSSTSFQQILDKLLLKPSSLGGLTENNVSVSNSDKDVLVNGFEGSVGTKDLRLPSPLSSNTNFLELVPLNDAPPQVQMAPFLIRMADLLKNASEGNQDIPLSRKPDTTQFLGWMTIKDSASETKAIPILIRLLKNEDMKNNTVVPSPLDVPVRTKEIPLPPTNINEKPKNLELVPEFEKTPNVTKSDGENNPGEKTIKILSQHSDNITGKAVRVLQEGFIFSENFFDKKVFTLSPVSPTPQSLSQAQSVINQIVTRVIIMMGDERSEITMQLKPEQLGEIKIKLVVEDMGIAAKLQVENPDIKTIIESQLPELKKALAEYGLRMEKFDVLVKQEFSQRQHQAWQDTRQPKDKINRAETDRVPPVLTQVTRSLGYNTIEIIA